MNLSNKSSSKVALLLGSITGMLALVAGVSSDARASILPKNNLHLQRPLASSDITEEQFNYVTDSIVEMWKPLAKIHGAELVAEKRWNDPTVNAYADQMGKTWKVTMFGGLARRPEVTLDAFALVVCHELGHHFAGYAFYDGDWAAAEGQSDYWATQVCARKIWLKSGEKNAKLAHASPRRLVNICTTTWKSPEDQALCTRVAQAGLSLAKLLGALNGEKAPSLDARDTSEVSSTQASHPHAQCRLDTYLHGALCTQYGDLKVIPGKKGEISSNSVEAEREAARYSCMQSDNFKVGYRPRCWFKEVGSPFQRLADDFNGLALTERNW